MAVAKGANGLVGLLRLLESIDGLSKPESLVARVADQLAKPRNDAVHRGSLPTDPERAYAAARAILDRYSPLAQPG